MVASRVVAEEKIDYLDLAVWDCTKIAAEEPYQDRTLLSIFTELPRSFVRIGTSGKTMSVRQAVAVLEADCDFVMVGEAAILNPDFPLRAEQDSNYEASKLPVTRSPFKQQGLSDRFVEYMGAWEGFLVENREC